MLRIGFKGARPSQYTKFSVGVNTDKIYTGRLHANGIEEIKSMKKP